MHDSNSILKLLCRPTPFPWHPKHVLLLLSELTYLNGILKAFKDKMSDLWEVNTILGARLLTQLTSQQGSYYICSGQTSKKINYWTCWSLWKLLISYFTVWQRDQCFWNIFFWFLAFFFFFPRITQTIPFTSPVLATLDKINICLVYPLSYFPAPACRCYWCERRVRMQPQMTLLWGKVICNGRVGKQREEWKKHSN